MAVMVFAFEQKCQFQSAFWLSTKTREEPYSVQNKYFFDMFVVYGVSLVILVFYVVIEVFRRQLSAAGFLKI